MFPEIESRFRVCRIFVTSKAIGSISSFLDVARLRRVALPLPLGSTGEAGGDERSDEPCCTSGCRAGKDTLLGLSSASGLINCDFSFTACVSNMYHIELGFFRLEGGLERG